MTAWDSLVALAEAVGAYWVDRQPLEGVRGMTTGGGERPGGIILVACGDPDPEVVLAHEIGHLVLRWQHVQPLDPEGWCDGFARDLLGEVVA